MSCEQRMVVERKGYSQDRHIPSIEAIDGVHNMSEGRSS